MSIRKKIIRTLKLSTFLTLLTGIACFGMIKLIDYMYAETINSGVPQLEQQQLIEKYIIEEAKFVQLYLLGNPESLQEYHSVQDQLKVAVEQLDLLFDETTSKEQLYSLKEQITTYEAQLNEVIQLYEGNRYKRALDLLKNEVIITQHDIEEASAAFTNETKSNFNELMEHVGNITLYSIIGLIIILSISLVIGRTTANKLNKEVISPLEQLNTAFNHLQKGELNYTLPPMQLQNEIGNLADSFRSMQNQLTQLIQATKHNAKNLNHISSDFVQITNEVNKTSAIISTNTQDAAETIINISNASKESRKAIDQSANALKNIAASTENMLNQMITTTKQATAGSHHIKQANQHMQEIHQSTNTTNSLIQTLAKQSKEIESFSKVITQITEQTNLLALNASIEAARAGEHGLGFAVVANEVRNLADESKKASGKIVQLTNEIQRGMNNVEQAILLNLNNVETGVEALQVADQTFTAIATEIFDVEQQTKLIFNETDLISVTSTQLASAMLQITEQIDEISAQMQEISAATMLQASSIATVTNSSTQLATNASTLELQLQHFKLNSDQ